MISKDRLHKFSCQSSIIFYLGIFSLLFFLFSIVLISNSLAAITCLKSKEKCIEGQGDIRNIGNFPVDPGCWKKRVIYECHEDADNNCQILRKQNCSQIYAKCKKMLNGSCVVQDETYNCPVKQCDIKKFLCGKDSKKDEKDEKGIFCIDGNCAPANPINATDEDVGKALSHLSVLNEVANQIKEQNTRDPIIFAGEKMECATYAMPGITKDCCSNNPGIFKCDPEDKNLVEMRKEGRAIRVGEYCHNRDKITKVCTSYHTAYCVFGSKIARIIQNDGRNKQLGIGFGYVNDDDKSSHVDCRGITVEELSRMDFKKMDFSELYDELRKKAEKRAPKKERLEEKAISYSYEDLKSRSTKNLKMPESPEVGISVRIGERFGDFYD